MLKASPATTRSQSALQARSPSLLLNPPGAVSRGQGLNVGTPRAATARESLPASAVSSKKRPRLSPGSCSPLAVSSSPVPAEMAF